MIANLSRASRLLRGTPRCLRGLSITTAKINDFSSVDGLFDHERIQKTAENADRQRDFAYFILGADRMIFASAARLAVIQLIANMSPSADVLAQATAEVDVGAVKRGSTMTVKWRGKPVFVRHRTDDEILQATNVNVASLPHPQTDAERAVDPEWLVVIGVCTHLGCVPISGAGDYGGWFCPCHGSHYDTSGRVRKGPAPENLEVPPYKLDGTKLTLG